MVKAIDAIIAVLLLIPLVALLAIPIYNSINPKLGGISFFYWYQILWMPLSAILYYVAAVLWHGKEKNEERELKKSSRKKTRGRS